MCIFEILFANEYGLFDCKLSALLFYFFKFFFSKISLFSNYKKRTSVYSRVQIYSDIYIQGSYRNQGERNPRVVNEIL